MNQLSIYKTLDEKADVFQTDIHYIIDSKNDFDDWYNSVVKKQSNARSFVNQSPSDSEFEDNIYNHYPFIFRGVSEAKFKVYTSAQRDWIINDMNEWAGKAYLEYINDLITKAYDKLCYQKFLIIINYIQIREIFQR